jgi:hypothetical protein
MFVNCRFKNKLKNSSYIFFQLIIVVLNITKAKNKNKNTYQQEVGMFLGLWLL